MLKRLAAALVALALAVPAGAAEVPYAVLHQALAAVKAAEGYPRLKAVQRIESKLDGVPPSAIRLVVHAKAGDIAVPVAVDGTISFPLDDALVAENPIVETNQPAGSLTLLVSIELALPPGTRLAATDLAAALDEADRLFATASAQDGRKVRGVEFRFPGGEGSVTLVGDTERLLVPDAEGRVLVMRDSDLAAAREVVLGVAPLQVLPFLER